MLFFKKLINNNNLIKNCILNSSSTTYFKKATTIQQQFKRMSTSTVKINNIDVQLTLPNDVSAETVLNAPNFNKWLKKIEAEKELKVNSIAVQSVDMFGKNVGFLKFKAEVVTSKEGRSVPGIIFCRGGSVAILVILKSKETGKEYSVLTVQTRVPVASFQYAEIPAGMLDGSGHFVGVAAKELKEETGLEVSEDKLVDLTKLAYGEGVDGVYPSPGGCDEFIRLFLFRETLDQAKIDELQHKLTGCLDENESITLDIVPLDELWKKSHDGKTLSALYLYEKLLKDNKL